MTNETSSSHQEATSNTGEEIQSVAVIDIGTSSIRMAVAEINSYGDVHILDSFSQAVSLGKDTFSKGIIRKGTIEECVDILKSYRRILSEYQISNTQNIRVVATSAVREASNRLAFVDRIFSATGFDVEPLDEAETNRITYLGVSRQLTDEPSLATKNTVITEIGGGSTELLAVQNGNVTFAHSYRLGSLRLRTMFDASQTPAETARHIMENQVTRVVEQISHHLMQKENVELIALGGDVRFALSQICPASPAHGLRRLDLRDLKEFAERILKLSIDEIVLKYQITFPDAETLAPALLAYVKLAERLHVKQVLVSNVNLRDGLLEEMATKGVWTDEFREQIVRSAIDLGHKFDFDITHAKHVANLSQILFRELQEEHQLEERYELILYIAALLHEIGMFISVGGYHKHSMYLIQNSELFGLSKQALKFVSLIARYHRRASPKPSHTGYASLNREGRVAVSKLSAILRVAVALDESHSQRVKEVSCRREKNRLVVLLKNLDDISLEQLALNRTSSLFEEIFGLQVLLRQVS